MQTPVTMNTIAEGLQSLDLGDQPVCVHSSLGSFPFVEGGADAVIDGVLDVCGSMMVPSFSWSNAVMPPIDQHFPRNGCDYSAYTETTSGGDRIHHPDSTVIDAKMGAIPRAVVHRSGRRRGSHAVCSFSALGPLADDLISGQSPDAVFAPLTALARHSGFVVLMGVGLDRLTLLHLAEKMAGRNLFRRWALDESGTPRAHEAGGCSGGFEKLGATVEPVRRTTVVGTSEWKAFPAAEVLQLAAAAIRKDPRITHCGDPTCQRCNDAMLGGPEVW